MDTYVLIEPPSPYATAEELRAWLKDVENVTQTPEVVAAVAKVKLQLAEVEGR